MASFINILRAFRAWIMPMIRQCQEPYHLSKIYNMKILILGIPKTGTTFLYSKIGKSEACKGYDIYFEPSQRRSMLFEKQMILDIKKSKNVVTKDVYTSKHCSPDHIHLMEHGIYDKKIIIIRDPRDQVISSFMFDLSSNKVLYEKTGNITRAQAEVYDIVSRKQQSPSDISFVSVVADCSEVLNIGSDYIENKLSVYNGFYHYIGGLNKEKYCKIKYEDLVDNNIVALEKYLGFSLCGGKNIVDTQYSRVVRSKQKRNWIKWFTQQDCEHFQDLGISNILDKYEYSSKGLNPSKQVLEASNCQEYLKKVWDSKYWSV